MLSAITPMQNYKTSFQFVTFNIATITMSYSSLNILYHLKVPTIFVSTCCTKCISSTIYIPSMFPIFSSMIPTHYYVFFTINTYIMIILSFSPLSIYPFLCTSFFQSLNHRLYRLIVFHYIHLIMHLIYLFLVFYLSQISLANHCS